MTYKVNIPNTIKTNVIHDKQKYTNICSMTYKDNIQNIIKTYKVNIQNTIKTNVIHDKQK